MFATRSPKVFAQQVSSFGILDCSSLHYSYYLPERTNPSFPPSKSLIMSVTSKGNRCGISWSDANSNCYNFCASDGECAVSNSNQSCWAGLNMACPVSLTRCGKTFTHATQNCGSYCLADSWCPDGEKCFTGVADICDFRCGVDWSDANRNCNPCRTGNLADCQTGQQCFSGFEKTCSRADRSSPSVWLLFVLLWVLTKPFLKVFL
jgi:hypothetical protein